MTGHVGSLVSDPGATYDVLPTDASPAQGGSTTARRLNRGAQPIRVIGQPPTTLPMIKQFAPSPCLFLASFG